MKFSKEQMVQRDLNFGIIDEVDNILIDEARTPLINSGPAEESTDKYYKVNQLVPSLKKEKHYQVDEKARTASLTEEGISQMEKVLNIDIVDNDRTVVLEFRDYKLIFELIITQFFNYF